MALYHERGLGWDDQWVTLGTRGSSLRWAGVGGGEPRVLGA